MPIAMAMLASCEAPPESTLERARREGFLRAGYSEEPPFAYVDESTGRVGGESPESLRAVVKDLGIEDIRWVQLDFGDLIPSLLQGRVDVVAAGIYHTPERERKLSFSIPSVCSGSALVVPQGSALRSIQDVVRDTAIRVAVLQESVEHTAARVLGVQERRILSVPNLTTGIAAVQGRSADAFAITLPTARRSVQSLPSGSLEARPYDPPAEVRTMLTGCSALAFRPQDVALAEAASEALRAYIGSSQHLSLLFRLGFAQKDLPPARRSQ